MKRFPKSLIGRISLIFAVFIFIGLLFPTIDERVPAGQTQSRNAVIALEVAIVAYRDTYNAVPRGNHAAILRALLRDNPRKIVFIEPPIAKKSPAPKAGVADDIWYDPWGSPYRLDVSDPKNPRVWSPGKNKKDEPDDPHSDDICSWR